MRTRGATRGLHPVATAISVALVFFVLVGVAVPPALAVPRVVVAPGNGLPGATVKATAMEFPDGTVSFWWNGNQALGTAEAGPQNASLTFAIPAGASPGPHVVRACAGASCAGSEVVADGSVNVLGATPPPTPAPTPRPTATPRITPRPPTPRPPTPAPTQPGPEPTTGGLNPTPGTSPGATTETSAGPVASPAASPSAGPSMEPGRSGDLGETAEPSEPPGGPGAGPATPSDPEGMPIAVILPIGALGLLLAAAGAFLWMRRGALTPAPEAVPGEAAGASLPDAPPRASPLASPMAAAAAGLAGAGAVAAGTPPEAEPDAGNVRAAPAEVLPALVEPFSPFLEPVPPPSQPPVRTISLHVEQLGPDEP